MKIVVEYTAQLKRAAGAAAETIELAESSTLDALLASLAARHGEEFRGLLFNGAGGRQPSVLVFVADRQIPREEAVELVDGQVVTLVSPISGG